MDISISRTYTINTGNFSSVKPSITVTLKDVNRKNFSVEYNELSDLADAVIATETLKISEEMETINNEGYKRYINTLREIEIDMNSEIQNYSEKHYS